MNSQVSVTRHITFLLIGLALVPGARPAARAQDVTFEHYTLDDGLSNNVVTSIVQDRVGFLWIATEDGLNRFDGIAFTSYKHNPRDPSSIASNVVLALACDSAGNLWAGTTVGLDRYDPGGDRFVHFDHRSDTTFALEGGIRQLAVDPSGGLWIATLSNGLLRYDLAQNHTSRFRPDAPGGARQSITCLYPARDGTVWYSLPPSGFTVLNPGTGLSTNISIPGGSASIPPVITSITEDRNGYIWYGTYGRGMGRFNRSDGGFRMFRHDPGKPGSLGGDITSSLRADSRGRIWVALYEKGLDRYDPVRGSFEHFPHDPKDPHSVSSSRVYALLEDRRGSVWVGTWKGGLSVYHPWRRKFMQYSHIPGEPASLSNDTVWALCEDSKGRLWVGTEGGGLNRLDPSRSGFVHYVHDEKNQQSLCMNYAIAVREDHAGRIWIGTYGGGLDRFDESRGTFVHYRHDTRHPLTSVSKAITKIFEDHAHQLWLGTTEGALERFDPGSGTSRRYVVRDSTEPGGEEREIEAIAEDGNGNLWIGTFDSGLYSLDSTRSVFRAYYRGGNGSLPVPGILSLAVDDQGTLWVGTFGGGLFRYVPSSDSFEGFAELDGLPSNYIKGIVPDDRGNLWLSSIKGLTRFNVPERTFRTYDVTDGVQSSEFRTGAYCRGSGGRIYFGGVRGFNVLTPDSMRDNPDPPPVVLTGFRIFDQPARTGPPLSAAETLELSYAQNFFSLEFVALDFSASLKNQYAYRLEGFDRDWVMCGSRRFASYTHLDGGEYVFRVRGSNNDGVWNLDGASVRIIIHPPFWETWWFRALLLVLVAGVPFLMYRNRYRRLLAVERTRSRIARDLHDELSATLSGINFFARAIARDDENTISPSSRRFLSLIHEGAGVLQDSIGDIIWSVNPGQDHWEQIVAKLRRYASDLFDSTSTAYRFDLPSAAPARPVPMERKRNIWLIYKEIVTNVARHSRCTHVAISLRFRDDRNGELTIEDDGVGFDPGVPATGNGLRNIRSRAGAAGITAVVTSSPGRGTHWTIRFRA